MYLKSLELHGFKSFPNRTVLTFERGATVIVGPNGSGKSNISDAMRWVLGEISSRNIRGNKMEDVIFGGTDARRPMGFAEVSVTFDNTEKTHRIDSPYDEITVTRRYYRSGDSEYLINRKPCRLKDIHELFMNTGVGREGYSIIGQGRIAEILSKKSEDRRNIFEEAAGISKFRHRKQESQRKLEETQSNMVRLKDILGELEGRVGPLEKEAEKARKYLEYYERKKRADVSLWLFDTQKLRGDLEKAEEAFLISKNELETIEEALATLQNQGDRLYEQSQIGKLRSEELLQKINQHASRIHALENALTASLSDAEHCKELMEQCRRRIAEIDGDADSHADEITRYDEKIRELGNRVDSLNDERLAMLADQQKAEMEAGELEKALEASLEKLNRAENRAVDLRIRIDVLKNAKSTDTKREESILAEIESYKSGGKKLAEDVERCRKSTESFQVKIDAADAVIREESEKEAALKEEREECFARMGNTKAECSGLAQRVDALRRLEEHFEGYGESVKFVMRAYGEGKISGKIYGPVSKLITMENRVVTAIETALGANIQNIVVEDEATAKAAIGALKAAGAGRATFYPLNSMQPGGELDELRRVSSMVGYVGRADQLVKFDPKYRNVMEWLLSRTAVFDTLDHASDAARAIRYKVRLVTLDGQVINAGGSYTGGSAKRDSGILSRSAEIEKLALLVKETEAQIRDGEKTLAELDAQIKECENKIQENNQRKELLYTMSRAQFAALDSAQAKLDANNELLQRLEGDRSEILNAGSRYQDEMKELCADLEKAESEIVTIRSERSRTDIRRNGCLDKRDELRNSVADISIAIAEAKKDVENAEQLKENSRVQSENLKTDRENQELRIASYQQKLSEMEVTQEENRKETDALRAELDALNKDRSGVEEGTQEFDRQINELRQKERLKNEQKDVCVASHNKNEGKLNRLREEQDRLSGFLWNEYEITYEEAKALDYPAVTPENRSEMVQEQTSNKMRLRALGAVNPSAIEEYAQVKERYDSLSAQVTDLTKSCEELSNIVGKIEEEMRESFLTAFTEINKNFGIVFGELFGGGTGELALTDPEDVLTSGIEIKAAPPGKIIKNLALLSGGEQAFVAIALVFAILKVNPTPFCIFDEIEAALDEVNVFRFGEYVKKFCEETQFVLITHRRGTMEVANRLYGITMPERGVSRALPLDVSEIESKKKELLPDEVS